MRHYPLVLVMKTFGKIGVRVGLLILSSKMYVYSITKNRLEIYLEFSQY